MMPAIPRLLPVVAVVSVLMLSLRVGMIWSDAGVAFAETAPKADPAAKAPSPSPEPAANTDAAKPPADGKSADGKSADKSKDLPQHFTAGEVEVLQELSKRRAEIDQRGEELDKREMLLKAAEKRVDDKIAKLQDFQQKLDAAVGKAKLDDDERIKGLVRVYETMKPKEAAAIFEGMDTASLLPIMTLMKDQKTALVLAAMAPEKARALTLALAQRHELPDVKTN